MLNKLTVSNRSHKYTETAVYLEKLNILELYSPYWMILSFELRQLNGSKTYPWIKHHFWGTGKERDEDSLETAHSDQSGLPLKWIISYYISHKELHRNYL